MKSSQIVNRVLPVYKNCEKFGEIRLSFNTARRDSDVNAKIIVDGLVDFVYEGYDFFEAFLALREDIEEKFSAIVGCVGCLKQVKISGMARSWSDGLAGHRVNEETLDTESVFLLDNVEEDEISSLMSISEQKKYRSEFREANKQRYIERNRILEERYQKEKLKGSE